MSTHRAVVRHGTHCAIEDLPKEPAGPGELIVAPEKVSICGTDMQILRGFRDDPAPVVGHEGLARVVEVGIGTIGFEIGDRVTINPTHPTDAGFLLGHNINGLLQERVRIPASAVSSGLISSVSPTIPAARGTLIEPLAVVTYALECLSLEKPDSLLIVGDGLIGNLAAAVAPRVLGEDVTVGMIHRSLLGLEWTASFSPQTFNGLSIADLRSSFGTRVALLSATHRTGTAQGMEEAIEVFGARLVAAHFIGGIAPETVVASLPGVDLHGVRMANTGGPWPPSRVRFENHSTAVTLSGNRGVPTSRLEDASRTLDGSAFGRHADLLITHDLPLEEGVGALNSMLSSGSRIVDGKLVVRLVTDVASSIHLETKPVEAM